MLPDACRPASCSPEDFRYLPQLVVYRLIGRYADAKALAQALGPRGEPILLGSIATRKYVDVLLAAFPQELLFPSEFVGRGDMSRGGLMLRSVDAHLELAYVPVRGAILRGARPPKLPPRSTRS